ncbi:MAG: acyltransferase [Lapillicoccus sp.]
MTAHPAHGPDTLGAPATPKPPGRRHLYEVDIVRLLTFVCVVGVHAVSGSMNPDNVASGAFVSLLHFTRGTFFLLSAFVLTYAQGSKPVQVRRFWPRRFLYVGLPYVVWSVIYWWVALGRAPVASDLGQLGHELLTGTGNYHLYFLLVSLQLYLLFPALVWLVRRTRGHHLALLLASGALELALLAVTHYVTWPGSWATVQANALVLAPTYQLYFVAGALAAVHHERFHAWVLAQPRAVVGALVGTAAVHVGVYLAQVPSSGSVFSAFDPLQPSVAPWTVAVTLGLYALGGVYARRRRPGHRLAAFVDQASVASFGVFLVHPLFLNTLLGRWLSWGYSTLDPTLSGVLAWAATLVLSFAFAALVIRTPLALPLAGRKRLRHRPTRSVTHA